MDIVKPQNCRIVSKLKRVAKAWRLSKASGISLVLADRKLFNGKLFEKPFKRIGQYKQVAGICDDAWRCGSSVVQRRWQIDKYRLRWCHSHESSSLDHKIVKDDYIRKMCQCTRWKWSKTVWPPWISVPKNLCPKSSDLKPLDYSMWQHKETNAYTKIGTETLRNWKYL